jgi:hypothetical protein
MSTLVSPSAVVASIGVRVMWIVNIAWDRDDTEFMAVLPVCRAIEP